MSFKLPNNQFKTIFFGSSDYCLPICEKLKEETSLLATVTKSDKPIGRKQILTPSAVKQFSLNNKITCFTPKDKNDLIDLSVKLKDHKPDYYIVADFGMIIPYQCIDYSNNRYINIHFSKLPESRGASPVQFTILKGDKSAWITYMLMDKGMDTGDILYQEEVSLSGNETTKDLYTKLFNIASRTLPDVLKKYTNKSIIPIPQDNSLASYTKLLEKEDGYIPWEIILSVLTNKQLTEEKIKEFSLFNNFIDKFQNSKSQIQINPDQIGVKSKILNLNDQITGFIERMIRALTPWPGAWTILEVGSKKLEVSKKRLKILKVHVEEKISSTIDHRPSTIKFVPDLVQLEGKGPVSWKQFLEAFPEILKTP
jgi:methionyl-tRNA formyltransferase